MWRKTWVALVLVLCIGVSVWAQDERKPGNGLILKGKAKVEISKSRSLADWNGDWTVEIWCRQATKEEEMGVFGTEEKGTGWSIWMANRNRLDAKGQSVGNPRYALLTRLPNQDFWRGEAESHVGRQDEWRHIAFCKQGNVLRRWFDGHFDRSITMKMEQLRKPTGDLWIGYSDSLKGTCQAGIEVRAFRVSKGVRYSREFEPEWDWKKDGDTVVLLEFDGKSKHLRDLSGRGHHGKVTGGKWRKDPQPEAEKKKEEPKK